MIVSLHSTTKIGRFSNKDRMWLTLEQPSFLLKGESVPLVGVVPHKFCDSWSVCIYVIKDLEKPETLFRWEWGLPAAIVCR